MVDSADNGCSIAFDPMPEPPTNEAGALIPQTPVHVRVLTFLQDKWKLVDCALKTHLACATRGNPAAKRLFEKQDWRFYAAIVDRFQLRENSYRFATLANL